MDRFADFIKGWVGQNPFSDNQGRNFSNKSIIKEFYPSSLFWTVFNNQHEILLGTRGSGKTFLMKMMCYSMLRRMNDSRAKKLVDEKDFIALYVPMHLERIKPLYDPEFDQCKQLERFQLFFNITLCQSLLSELKAVTNDILDSKKQIRIIFEMTTRIHRVWFGTDDKEVNTFELLIEKLTNIYYNKAIEDIPKVFKSEICAPLVAVKMLISNLMEWDEEPTWIICIDEAEFLNELMQKCINSMFRSDSNRIALKVATLPFYHTTLDTLDENVKVTEGNDFSYRVVDMLYEGKDFMEITNKLVRNRLNLRFDEKKDCDSLENFLGVIGNDDLIDYFRKEMGTEKASRENIEEGIINSFSEKKKNGSKKYTNRQKTIFDKYAHIYYVREMYKKARVGHNIPGWFAGAKTVRKIAQGNPRIFLQIMNELFEKARQSNLTPKAQHQVVTNYAHNFCEATKALEKQGPQIFKAIDYIGEDLKKKVHEDELLTYGTAFRLKHIDKNILEWLYVAIAYSRIIVDDETKKRGITSSTKFSLANVYAVNFWLPMRNDTPINIKLFEKINNKYIVKMGDNFQYTLPLEDM